jgi:hypothetical protein
MSKKKNDKFVVLEDEGEEKIIEAETVEYELEREELAGKGTTKGEGPYNKISRITKIGIAILIACIMVSAALNSLPFTKVSDYETEYTAFYNSDLEREAYDSAKAPVRVIENNEVERLYLERIQLIENSIIAIAILSIITILYGYLYNSNEEKNFAEIVLSKGFILIVALCLYGSNSFIGLLFEKLFEEKILLLPYVCIYILLFSIIVTILARRIIAKNAKFSERILEEANECANDIFNLSILFLILIPVLPIILGMIADTEDTVYTEQSINVASKSEYLVQGAGIYEIGIINQSIDQILNLIAVIIILCIVSDFGLLIYEKRGREDPVPNLLVLLSNTIGILILLILYENYIIYINIENFEEHYNQVFYEGDLEYIDFYFANLFLLFVPLFIAYKWVQYYTLTFKNAYNSLIEKI